MRAAARPGVVACLLGLLCLTGRPALVAADGNSEDAKAGDGAAGSAAEGGQAAPPATAAAAPEVPATAAAPAAAATPEAAPPATVAADPAAPATAAAPAAAATPEAAAPPETAETAPAAPAADAAAPAADAAAAGPSAPAAPKPAAPWAPKPAAPGAPKPAFPRPAFAKPFGSVGIPKAKGVQDFLRGMQHGFSTMPSFRGIGRITDINRTGTCKDALNKHCAHVERGNARLASCLRDANKAAKARKEPTPSSSLCTAELSNFYRAAVLAEGPSSVLGKTRPTVGSAMRNMTKKLFHIDPVQGFQTACADDAKLLCPQVQVGSPVLLCLKAKKPKLSEPCRRKIFQVQQHESEDLSLDTPLLQACQEDLQRLPTCKGRGPAGSHKACLQSHRSELSEKCREGLFGREQEDAEDIRLNVDVFTTCKAEVASSCKDQSFGEARMLHCLWEHSIGRRESFSEACRTKVRTLVAHGLTDYRLDFRVRGSCSADIEKLCLAEKERVDKLTVSELFGGDGEKGSFAEGASGEVIRCLKSKMSELSSQPCKSQIMHVVKVQAVQARADPVLARACKNDISLYCSGVKQESLHLCLRRNLDKLEEGCKKTEILQGSLESKAVTLKPMLLNACRSAISSFCKDVPVGEAQVIECLHDHMEQATFPARCKIAVESDLEASNHDYRLKYGISERCKVDIRSLCKDSMSLGGGTVLSCLKDNIAKVSDDGCKNSVIRFAKQGASNIKLAPKVFSACMQDVQRFCADVPPGAGKVHACLLQHKQQLSPQCSRAEFQSQVTISKDIRTDPKAMVACASSIEKLCRDVQMGNGRVWRCLQDHQGFPDMAAACAAVVKNHTRLQHSEFRMNPALSNFCEPDAKNLCGPEMEKADRKDRHDFTSEGGVITCLIEKMEQVLNPACKASLRRKAGQRVSDVHNDPIGKSMCIQDVEKFCKDAKAQGGSNVQKCLQANLEKLSEGCRKKQKFYMGVGSSDIRMNQELAKACTAAEKRFCSQVSRGGGRTIYCLLDHMHHPEMEATCREALKVEQEKRTKSLHFNPALMKHCKQDIEVLNREGLCPKTRAPGGSIDCLSKNVDRVKNPECSKSITDVLRLQSADIRAKPGMYEACAKDIASLCPGVSPGKAQMHKCLQQHEKDIKDPKCKDMVHEVELHDQKSFKVNFRVRTHCKNERKTFCKDAVVGASHQVMDCLALHVNETGFSQECASALKGSHVESHLLKDKVANQLANLQSYILMHRGFIEKWAGVALGCVVAIVALCAFGVSYWVLQQRFKKVGYTVTVPPNAMED